MRREFANAVWNRYKAGGIVLFQIAYLKEQRAYVRSVTAGFTSKVLEQMDNVEDSWDTEGMLSVEEVASSGIRDKLRDVQRIC